MDSTTILSRVDHRSFPLPKGPWIMRQNWHELLFAHWPLAPELLRSLVPAQLMLDTFEGESWLGVVPFLMSDVRPRALPAVGSLSHFPELNVRTYVTVDGIPGVYFFSLDAGNPVAVFLARQLFHLPYFNATMSCERQDGFIHYRSRRTHRGADTAELWASYRPVSDVVLAPSGSLVHWLTERYCLYTVVHDRPYRCVIHHHPWRLQTAELEVKRNTMALTAGIRLPDLPPLLHYAEHQDVLSWPLHAAGK